MSAPFDHLLISTCPSTSREQYRAKNDIYNAVYAGFLAGGILALQSGGGPRGVLGGGAAFAAFSGAIDLYMRKEVP